MYTSIGILNNMLGKTSTWCQKFFGFIIWHIKNQYFFNVRTIEHSPITEVFYKLTRFTAKDGTRSLNVFCCGNFTVDYLFPFRF